MANKMLLMHGLGNSNQDDGEGDKSIRNIHCRRLVIPGEERVVVVARATVAYKD